MSNNNNIDSEQNSVCTAPTTSSIAVTIDHKGGQSKLSLETESDLDLDLSPITFKTILARCEFQIFFIQNLIGLFIFANKLHTDVKTVIEYHEDKQVLFEVVSLVAVVFPPVNYAFYLLVAALEKRSENEDRNFAGIFTYSFNGLMLMPWQVKSYLDGLYYSSQRLFLFREATPEEMKTMEDFTCGTEFSEFFENFYSGFLQLILQCYIYSLQLDETSEKSSIMKDQLIASSCSIFSMLLGLRRRDDGLLTMFLSMVGQFAMFFSRVMVFALTYTVLYAYCNILLIVHVLCFTIWIFLIALDSHRMPVADQGRIPCLNNGGGDSVDVINLFLNCFLYFGVPSLLLWPIMFQLKQYKRPLKFLLVCTLENVGLLVAWNLLKQTDTDIDYHSQLSVIVTTAIGVCFQLLYLLAKPSLTDQVILNEMRYQGAETYGSYFLFCDLVFKLDPCQVLRADLVKVDKFIEREKNAKNATNNDNNSNNDSSSNNDHNSSNSSNDNDTNNNDILINLN